jgi:hypothetical protein
MAAILLCFSMAAFGKQISSQSGNSISAIPARDCSPGFDRPSGTEQAENQEQRPSPAPSDSLGATENAETIPAAVHMEQDLKILQQTQDELAQCILPVQAQFPAQDAQGACFGRLLTNFEMRHDGEPEQDIPIGQLRGSSAFFYESGMTIDADGAPNAYHPDNSGIDDLANAGAPGTWEGLAKDADGEPFIQGPNDPFPGYYVSATALADRSKPPNDPTRYVDASKIPFVVLPGRMARQLGARPGDFAVVFNRRNGKSSFAIFADVGPFDRIGEGSVALAENLGIQSDARNGGTRRGVFFLVFPGSGNGRPRSIEEIGEEGRKLLQGWETSISLDSCMVQQPAPALERNLSTN